MTPHVIFDESVFPYTFVSTVSSSPSHSSPLSPPSDSLHNVVLPACFTSSSIISTAASFDTLPSPTIPQTLSGLDFATQFSLPKDPDFHPKNLYVVLPPSPMNLHTMITRSKDGI